MHWPTSGLRQLRLMRMRMDYVLILALAALVILGLMMVYSSTFDMAYVHYDNPNRFFTRQLIWTGLGMVALLSWPGSTIVSGKDGRC